MCARVGIIPGDPGGIGPELVARLLSRKEDHPKVKILLIGDRHVFERGQHHANALYELEKINRFVNEWSENHSVAIYEVDSIAPKDVQTGKVTRASGASTLKILDNALELWRQGVIDALVFGPFNKAAMHQAGIGTSDELHYMAEKLNTKDYICELNTLDGIWTSRVTSHIALRAVADSINPNRIREAVRLIDRTLKRSGIKHPRISVAALNPHAGDGGNFGREEIEIIEPVVQELARAKIKVDGPWPADTIFLKASHRKIDAVVTMYHDQGQIALKLLGFDRGVTVQGGLPLPVTTPAHGTAFDIAGKGHADPGAFVAAFQVAVDMATNWEKQEEL